MTEAIITATSSSTFFPASGSLTSFRNCKCPTILSRTPSYAPSLSLSRRRVICAPGVRASISATPERRTSSDDLAASILSKVAQTDRGALLTEEENNSVAQLAQELQRYCVSEPVKSPLIFGEWDVVYCSVPTSPGGPYRSALGRLLLKTREMVQVLTPPCTVINKVSFYALGFIDGEVCLKGELKVLDERWVQVVFEPPELKLGAWKFRYGGESEVKLEITYIDEKLRLGKGSRGSLFVFERRKQAL